MYLVIRSLKCGNDKIDYQIKKGDILKIGRVKFAVKLMQIMGQVEVVNAQQEELEFQEFLELEKDKVITSVEQIAKMNLSEEDTPKCKCCWESHATLDDPLFIPCVCKFSHIHLSCLKIWMNSKKSEKDGSGNFKTYYWKKFMCEVCTTKYPLAIKADERNYSTVEYEKPEGNYLVLESLEQEKNESRIIHIIKPSDLKDTFKLGRGHEADLRINDISVSRCHSFIKFKRNKFMLEDNMSKFGTLVLVKDKVPILPNYNKAMQVGRTVVNFSIKPISSSGRAAESEIKEAL